MSARPAKRSPGRPKTGITKKKPNISINIKLMARAAKQAFKLGMSTSAFVESCIQEKVEQLSAKKGAES